MRELETYISTVYKILEQMAVTGQNQELVVAAKAQLRKAIEAAREVPRSGDVDGGK